MLSLRCPLSAVFLIELQRVFFYDRPSCDFDALRPHDFLKRLILPVIRTLLEPSKMIRYQMSVVTSRTLDKNDTSLVGSFGEDV